MPIREISLKSCLISARFGADLGVLPAVLERMGIDWQWGRSEPERAGRLPGDLRGSVRRVDFVLGVLEDGPASANVLFELGVAAGLGKPLFIVLTGSQDVPQSLQSFPHVRAPLTDEPALTLHLDLFWRRLRSTQAYPMSKRVRLSTVVSDEASGFKARVRYDNRPNTALEAQVAHLIESIGGRVLMHPQVSGASQRYLPDLLFWLPEADAEILNPAVAEVRGSAHHVEDEPEAVEERLLEYLRETGVRTALLILDDPLTEIRFRGGPTTGVFRLSLTGFEQLVYRGQLVSALRLERNRAAHGIR